VKKNIFCIVSRKQSIYKLIDNLQEIRKSAYQIEGCYLFLRRRENLNYDLTFLLIYKKKAKFVYMLIRVTRQLSAVYKIHLYLL